jgi:hypothetical protein
MQDPPLQTPEAAGLAAATGRENPAARSRSARGITVGREHTGVKAGALPSDVQMAGMTGSLSLHSLSEFLQAGGLEAEVVLTTAVSARLPPHDPIA